MSDFPLTFLRKSHCLITEFFAEDFHKTTLDSPNITKLRINITENMRGSRPRPAGQLKQHKGRERLEKRAEKTKEDLKKEVMMQKKL